MTKRMYRNNFRRVLTLFLALILSLSAITVSGSAASREVLPDGSYIIYTESLVTCLNVQYNAKDGGKIVTDTAGLDATAGTTLENNEIWVLHNVDRGYVTLSPKNAPNCYLSGENGFDRQLVIRQCVPSEAIYQWLPIEVGNGAYVFKNRQTGYVIDVCNGWNADAGTTVLQYHQNGFSAAQSFYPVRISHFAALTPSNRETGLASYTYKVGLYYNRNQVWNEQYGLKAGGFMVCDPYNGEANEQIYIQREGNGLYSLRFASNTNLCIAPPSVFAGEQLKVKYYDGTASCLYEIYKVGSTYSFRNKATGLMVDDLYARTATGTSMISYSYNGDNAQRFYLTGIIKASSSKVTLNVPDYKQYDSRWGSVMVGSKNIKQIGCVITSAAMTYSYKTGSTVYPNTMRNMLEFSGNNLKWNSLTQYGFATKTYNTRITNSILSTIYAQLKAGKPVIIGGDRGGGNAHYVVVTGYTGTSTTSFSASNFTINDPNSTSRTTLSQFLSTYSTVVRLIY